MKELKKAVLLMVSILVFGLFTGCGSSYDASAHVKALMDNSYKNDSASLVEQKIGTAEEASLIYEQGVDAEVASLLEGLNVSEETRQGYRDFVVDLLSKAEYTVGEAEKNGDNYTVTITYKKMKVFEPAVEEYLAEFENHVEEWQTKASEGSITQDEMLEEVSKILLTALQNSIANVEYGEEQTATIGVDLINQVYTPNQGDFTSLEAAMFDAEALANMNVQ